MKNAQISFKFKHEKNYDSIKFYGNGLSLKEVKTKIKEKLQQNKIAPGKSNLGDPESLGPKEKDKDDLIVYDEQTRQSKQSFVFLNTSPQ
jgi:hypothetical protein